MTQKTLPTAGGNGLAEKPWHELSEAERMAIDQTRSMVPAGAAARPWDEMTPAEKLAYNAQLALDVTRRILELAVDPDNVRLLSQIKDTALSVLSTQVKVDEDHLRSRRDLEKELVLQRLVARLPPKYRPPANGSEADPSKPKPE